MPIPEPLWKKILAGGVALGAGLHLASAALPAEAGGASEHAPGEAGDLKNDDLKSNDPVASTPEWGRLQATLAEADEVASGRRGPYPFDKAGRDRLLAAMASLAADVDALAAKGFLDPAAVVLMKSEVEALEAGVRAMRPKEMEFATCYEPMWFEPGRASARRLAERVEALDALAAKGRVSPAVLARIRAAVERDLAGLDEATLGLMKGPERDRAVKDVARARAALRRLAGR